MENAITAYAAFIPQMQSINTLWLAVILALVADYIPRLNICKWLPMTVLTRGRSRNMDLEYA